MVAIMGVIIKAAPQSAQQKTEKRFPVVSLRSDGEVFRRRRETTSASIIAANKSQPKIFISFFAPRSYSRE